MKTYNILFLCTGNSARSVMSEALATTMSNGRFIGYSAGSHPTGKINPFAIEMIAPTGYDTSKLRSKSWDEFALPDAPKMDFIITVCDNAAGEACPVWPGQPMTAHWGVPDPAAVEGSDTAKALAFADAYRQLSNRISIFVNLPLKSLDAMALKQRLVEIGKTAD